LLLISYNTKSESKCLYNENKFSFTKSNTVILAEPYQLFSMSITLSLPMAIGYYY